MGANNTKRVISLFTGAGGLDIGFERSGNFEIVAAVEKVPAFRKTLEINRDAGRTRNRNMRVYGDINEISPQEMMDELGVKPGEIDVVIGGPPCQSFSNAGRKGSLQDARGTMLWKFLEFVDVIKPKMFVMENVRGLMSAAVKHRAIKDRPASGGEPLTPDEEPGSVIREFISDLGNGYRLDIFEVNSANYGSPQIRERVLFIGNRFNHLVDFPPPTHGTDSSTSKPFKTLRDAFDGLIEDKQIIVDFSERKKKYLALVPQGGNWRSLPDEIAAESMGRAYFAKGGRSGWWRRLTFDLPSPTLVTLPNHASTSLCHPVETRSLSLGEYARIQEFPDDWEFAGKPTEQYAQVGNAVPIKLGEVCGRVVHNHLLQIVDENYEIRAGDNPLHRIINMQSHVRTRKWFKDGKAILWQDGASNADAQHAGPKHHPIPAVQLALDSY